MMSDNARPILVGEKMTAETLIAILRRQLEAAHRANRGLVEALQRMREERNRALGRVVELESKR